MPSFSWSHSFCLCLWAVCSLSVTLTRKIDNNIINPTPEIQFSAPVTDAPQTWRVCSSATEQHYPSD